MGAGLTIWTGSAFDCSPKNNEILLRHSQFEVMPMSETCNNGRIIGHGISGIFGSEGIKYISQLIIQLNVNDTLEGETVKCVHNNLRNEIVLGTHVITHTTTGTATIT